MREFNINYNKTFKPVLIIYLAIFVIGAVCAGIFGVELDINFSGGTKIAYSYSDKIEDSKIEKTVKETIDQNFTVSKSTSIAGDTQTFEIALIGKNSLPAQTQEKLTTALQKEFKDNKIELYSSNSVSPTIAGAFFLKSIVAMIITAIGVVIYVGFRFRKIGGILGDKADIGCGCVINPGTVIGKGTSVYPLTSLRGVIPEGCIVKSLSDIVVRL